MPGHLFTEYFLTDGIRQTPERQSQRSAFNEFRDAARRLFQAFPTADNPNESQTEQDLLRPLLELLGWTDDLPQQTTSGGENIPDLLLFPDAQAKSRATTSNTSPFLEALAVAELKRFRRPLDTRGKGKGTQTSSPHAQILRYLREAETAADGNLRWGILTNGAVWRLYDQKTRPRATAFYEADLQALLEADDEDSLRTFHLLFRRSAFVRRPGAVTAFLETALAAGRRYEQRVAESLAGVVFDRVFPQLLQALADTTHQPMPAIREAALIFLYRLLFVLYAEDRGLLPVNDAAYDDYGLRKRVRDDVAQRKARNDTFSSVASSYYDHLTTLFRLIDQGDPSIGLPPYNGGLFAHDAASLLYDVRLPDDVIADVVYDLSHTQTDGQPRYVNYRDMSVQQLGSIYERLLEQEPVLDEDGWVHVRPNPYARKDSGSFYTPQDLVDLIVDQTLTPLIEERLDAFETRANELRSDRRPRSERRAELARLDPAQAVLDLKVLDPAMGSGHFLVT
ncbi:MAG: restriction endonuclease, partial [Chloroflexi bacterium]|nr:restriction endonuclease [Chloroflexota bacterium]